MRRFAIIAALLAACTMALWVRQQFITAGLAARESAQRALLTDIVKSLAEHHLAHEKYPETLDDLPLTYPDGGDSSLLELFEYTPLPHGYRLKATGVSTGDMLSAEKRGDG